MRPKTDASAAILAALRAALGGDRISTAPIDITEAMHDALSVRGVPDGAIPPAAVVRPRSAEEIGALFAAARRAGFAVVPRGGGSGLMGGALPRVEGTVVLDLRSLDAIEVDAPSRLVRAGAGARLDRVEAACGAAGLTLGHDPWTIRIATVGGAIATDGMGYRAGRFGSMGDLVAGIEAVTPAGDVIRTPPLARGPERTIARLAAGSEGTLLVLVHAWLRLRPRPEARIIRGYRFPTFEAAVGAASRLMAADLAPAILEARERARHPAVAFTADEPPVLFAGYEGPARLAALAASLARDVLCRAGGEPLDDAAAEGFWRERHAIGDAYAAGMDRPMETLPAGANFDFFHVAVPPARLLALDARASEAIVREGVHRWERGLWADDSLYTLTLIDPALQGADPERIGRVRGAVMAAASALGGSIEAIHGIGTHLAPAFARHAPTALTLLRRLKRGLDPEGVLNPGKLGL
jgi:FAD/FMN-containing dehydrogenase